MDPDSVSPADAIARIAYARPLDRDALATAMFLTHFAWLSRVGARYLGMPVDAEQVRDVLVDLFVKLDQGKRPLPETHVQPGARLMVTLHNLAKDHLRSRRAQKRGGGIEHADLESPGAVATLGTFQDPDAAIRSRELNEELEAALAQAQVLPRYRVAFRGWHAPPVSVDELEAAHGQTKRSAEGRTDGLARAVGPTHELLRALFSIFPLGVSDNDEGRTELAFILRSDHPGPWQAWSASLPRERRTAMDTVRKWVERARERLQALLGEVRP